MAENSRAHHGQVLGVVCGFEKESRSQGGSLPVQDHLLAGGCANINLNQMKISADFYF